jgi:hypothetical protein
MIIDFDDSAGGRETPDKCAHERITQTSVVYAETYWNAVAGGGYEPEPAGSICLSRITHEDTIAFVCASCGAPITAL